MYVEAVGLQVYDEKHAPHPSVYKYIVDTLFSFRVDRPIAINVRIGSNIPTN